MRACRKRRGKVGREGCGIATKACCSMMHNRVGGSISPPGAQRNLQKGTAYAPEKAPRCQAAMRQRRTLPSELPMRKNNKNARGDMRGRASDRGEDDKTHTCWAKRRQPPLTLFFQHERALAPPPGTLALVCVEERICVCVCVCGSAMPPLPHAVKANVKTKNRASSLVERRAREMDLCSQCRRWL